MISTAESISARHTAAVRDHFVHFYEEDDELLPDVARFLRNGLEAGCAAIHIGSPQHREQLKRRWNAEGFDFAQFEARGQLVDLDAEQTLARFAPGDDPDPALFEQTVGALVRAKLERFGNLVAFGEMVALLAERGAHPAALRLEALWNRLAQSNRFALYCAYPLSTCGTAQLSGAFKDICAAHSHVMPVGGDLQHRSESGTVRMIAELQQKALALQNEVRVRSDVEARLREREAELSDFLENGIVSMHRVGPDGTILWANRAELEMLGYERDEFVGRNIAEFHVDRTVVTRILETLKAGGSLREQPASLICRDGSVKRVLISSNAQMRDGEFVSTRCFTRDVTERWLAQEALRERTAILHLAMQSARMGYWIAELSSGVVRLSGEAAELLGFESATELTLEAFAASISSADRAAFTEAVHQAAHARRPLHCRFRWGESPTGRAFEVRGEAIYDDHGTACRIYGICSEVFPAAAIATESASMAG